jgi:hypothetical protein
MLTLKSDFNRDAPIEIGRKYYELRTKSESLIIDTP